jgi:hypothetical protein
VPRSVLTLRRVVPADAETLARTGWLAQRTWRAFAPPTWTPRSQAEGIALIRGADTLREHERGMPWAVYGRSLLPPAAATRENRAVDAGVGSRP